VVTWRVLAGGQCAPLSPAEDLLGDTRVLLEDVRFLNDQSQQLIAEARRLLTASQQQTALGRTGA
jgi:hypothetical protein